MSSYDVAGRYLVWKRLFGMDVDKKRHAAGLVPIAAHLRQLEKRHPETPLADQLLAEIEAEGPTETTPKKWHRLPPKPESKVPGVTPGDLFRIFGSGARTILKEADWLEIPEADRQAILQETVRWVYDDGVFRDDGQWHEANMVVR